MKLKLYKKSAAYNWFKNDQASPEDKTRSTSAGLQFPGTIKIRPKFAQLTKDQFRSFCY